MSDKSVEEAPSEVRMAMTPDNFSAEECEERLATLILAARSAAVRELLEGEPRGPWGVWAHSSIDMPGVYWYSVDNKAAMQRIDGCTEAQARAVANALNALEGRG